MGEPVPQDNLTGMIIQAKIHWEMIMSVDQKIQVRMFLQDLLGMSSKSSLDQKLRTLLIRLLSDFSGRPASGETRREPFGFRDRGEANEKATG